MQGSLLKGCVFLMPEPKQYFCSRPALASYLQGKGFEGKEVVNRYNPDRPAWTFELTEELASVVAAYFKGIGGKVPAFISTYLQQLEAPDRKI